MVPVSDVARALRPLSEPWHPFALRPLRAPARRMHKRRRGSSIRPLVSLLVALGLHAALIASAWIAPRPSADDGFWVPVSGEIDIDIEPVSDQATAPAPAVATAARSKESGGDSTAPVSASRLPGARSWGGRGAVPELPAGVPPALPAVRPEYDGPAPRVPMAGNGSLLGAGAFMGANSEGVPSAMPAPTAAPKREIDRSIATKLLAEPLRERDRALGLTLPAAGNVASALGSAVRSAIGPVPGSATFLAILTPSGRLLGITPLAWNGSTADAWASAATSAAASLSGRSFQMVAPFSNGAVVWVDVTSSFVLPSGATSGIQPDSGGFRFDVADIGRRKQQVVRTSVRVAAVK